MTEQTKELPQKFTVQVSKGFLHVYTADIEVEALNSIGAADAAIKQAEIWSNGCVEDKSIDRPKITWEDTDQVDPINYQVEEVVKDSCCCDCGCNKTDNMQAAGEQCDDCDNGTHWDNRNGKYVNYEEQEELK